MRSFPSPAESTDEPISLVIYDAAGKGGDGRQQEALVEEILRNGQGNDRVLLDLSSGSSWLIHRLAAVHPDRPGANVAGHELRD